MNKWVCVFISFLVILCLCSCSKNEWVYTDTDGYNSVIVSPEGAEYRFWDYDFYIVGLKSEKKVGMLLQKFEEGNKPVYYIKGADSDRCVVIKNSSGNLSMEPEYDFKIYTKAGEGFGYDYRSPNVSGVVFIPRDSLTRDLNYLSYMETNGIFGSDAKAIMESILLDRTDEEVFSDVYMNESYDVRHDDNCMYLGELAYSPENVDWFAYRATVYYHPESGFYIGIPRFSTADMYSLPNDTARILGISI